MPNMFGRAVTGVYQFQSDFTVMPSSGQWYPLSAYERSDGEARSREADPLLGRGFHNNRDPVASAPSLPVGAGQISVPVCFREFGFWLKSLLGAPVTTGSAPNYVHTYESGKDSLPYLAQSKYLAANTYRRTRGLIINTMAITLEKAGGYPRAVLGAMLRDEARATSQVSGTVNDAFDLLRVPASKPYAKYNGSSCAVTAFSLNYSNQLEPNQEFNGSEYPSGFDPGDVQVSAQFTTRYTGTEWDELADAETAGEFEIGWALDANKSIAFQLPVARIGRSPLSVSGPGRLVTTYDVLPEQDDTKPALKVILKTDVDAYPPAPPPPPPPP